MRIREIIKEGDVVQFPGAQKPEPESKFRVLKPGEEIPAGAEPVDLLDVFGSKGMRIVRDALGGKSFFEKPSYFEDLDNRESAQIDEFQLRKIEKELEKAGLWLPEYDCTEIFGRVPKYPQQDADIEDLEPTFVIHFPNDRKYLVDTTGARSYIRMWMKVV